ncbi:Large-conductance mechanosensitive channel [Patulibacter medicamentivorans]|uniref:Large-conductance mechanosensitive channel n=2 Tax=Patulibacter medicamentivorans TaxID=1097667 RepID=H0E2R7_9ACTN|nr:Large-conductance mechanosensitive channel [Patulibacter medicamentivorans]
MRRPGTEIGPPDDRRGRLRRQLAEARAPPATVLQDHLRPSPPRPRPAHGGLAQLAEAQLADAVDWRVVEQPQQPSIGHREDRLRARPGRRRHHQADRLAGLERAPQLVPEGAADGGREPLAGSGSGRAPGPPALVRRRRARHPQRGVGGVDQGHPIGGGPVADGVGVPLLGQSPEGRRDLVDVRPRGDAEHLSGIDAGSAVHPAIVAGRARSVTGRRERRTQSEEAPERDVPVSEPSRPVGADRGGRGRRSARSCLPPTPTHHMLKELKDFLFKGNLVDIAVAFILATAFGLVVKSLVDDILMPIIAAIVGKPSFNDIVIDIGDAKIMIGTFITLVINFLIIGTVLFFIVKAITKVMKKEEAEEGPSDEVALLTEIRDALAHRG